MARPRIIAGIDIGSSKVATVIASVDEEDKVKIIGAASIPSQGIRKGQIVNIEEAADSVVESVESAERMAGYNLTRALVSVGGPHIASQNSKGVVAVAEPEGEINREDVNRVMDAAQAISLPSSREIIHVLPRDFTVDGQEGIKDPIGMSGVRLEIETHIISGSSTAIRNLSKCVSEVGADIESLVASGLASAESVLSETEKELGVIVADIGGGTTDIVIFVEGAPAYTTVLPIGAKNVTNDLAIGLRLPLEAAEKIKIALSDQPKKITTPSLPEETIDKEKKEKTKSEKTEKSEGYSKSDKDELNLSEMGILEEKRTVSRKTLVEGIIKPRLNEIFTMVGIEIKKSGFAGLTPSGVVICGGGAQTVGIKEAAKRSLSMPVRIGTPVGLTGLIDDVQTPDFASSTGLVLYGSKEEGWQEGGFSLASLGKSLERIPVRGFAGRAVDLIKSFLP
jgi:cell division protein FtsA